MIGRLREVIKVEDTMWNRGVGLCFLRIKWEIDVEKPLMARFQVFRKEKGKVWVEIKYKKIIDFYFGCGRMGHIARYYEKNGDLDVVGEGDLGYG